PPNENTRETSSPWSAATAWLAAIIPPKLAMQSEAAMRQRKAAGDRSNGGRSQTRRATKAPLLFVTPRTPRRYLNPGNGETLITGTQTKSTRKAGRRVAAGRVELALREADRPPHLRAREVDAVEIGAAEVRAFEVGADEAGVGEVGAREARARQHRTVGVDVAQVAAGEAGAVHHRRGEVGLPQPRAGEVAAL